MAISNKGKLIILFIVLRIEIGTCLEMDNAIEEPEYKEDYSDVNVFFRCGFCVQSYASYCCRKHVNKYCCQEPEICPTDTCQRYERQFSAEKCESGIGCFRLITLPKICCIPPTEHKSVAEPTTSSTTFPPVSLRDELPANETSDSLDHTVEDIFNQTFESSSIEVETESSNFTAEVEDAAFGEAEGIMEPENTTGSNFTSSRVHDTTVTIYSNDSTTLEPETSDVLVSEESEVLNETVPEPVSSVVLVTNRTIAVEDQITEPFRPEVVSSTTTTSQFPVTEKSTSGLSLAKAMVPLRSEEFTVFRDEVAPVTITYDFDGSKLILKRGHLRFVIFPYVDKVSTTGQELGQYIIIDDANKEIIFQDDRHEAGIGWKGPGEVTGTGSTVTSTLGDIEESTGENLIFEPSFNK